MVLGKGNTKKSVGEPLLPPPRRGASATVDIEVKEAPAPRERKQTEAAAAASVASAASKKGKVAILAGVDVLDSDEIQKIACGEPVKLNILTRIYGLDQPIVHPKISTVDECKTVQKWNPNSFAGLGYRARKKAKGEGFESTVARSQEVPFGGLKNLGATCYMNSMLQCLFANQRFRNGVFELAQPDVMSRQV